MPPIDWTHEKCLLLISKFKTHEALWNRNVKEFHNPKKKEEEWYALAQEMNAPHVEVKKKIECLRGSYRRERSKVKSSKDVYSPKWFAYKFLHFLGESKSSNVIYNCSMSNDHEAVSSKIPHSQEQNKLCSPKRNSESLDKDEYILPDHAIELFTKKLRSDTVGLSQKSESTKEELGRRIEETAKVSTEATDTRSETLATPSDPTEDRAGWPNERRREVLSQDENQFNCFRNATLIRNIRNSIGTPTMKQPSKLLRASTKESAGLPDRVRRMVSQNKVDFSPKKRRMFRSGCGPYRPIRPKPKSKDTKTHKEPIKTPLKPNKKYPGRKIQPIVEVTSGSMDTLSDPLETIIEPTLDGTGLSDRLLEKEQVSPKAGLENVGVGGQSEITMAEPSKPYENVLARQSSKDVNDESSSVFKMNSTPLPRQEDDKSDDCTAFGQLVESSLRKLSSLQRIKAKMKLSQVLWDLELEALSHNTSA
uniref:MADF domain-containing protein n=1 Tax=Lygus hesperus TaxID=30085 RepID=A0A146M037_LYGHE